jgi:hypothetical protein
MPWSFAFCFVSAMRFSMYEPLHRSPTASIESNRIKHKFANKQQSTKNNASREPKPVKFDVIDGTPSTA